MNTTDERKVLRVTFPNHFPYINYADCVVGDAIAKSCGYPGLMYDIFKLIAREIDYRLEPVMKSDIKFEDLESITERMITLNYNSVGIPFQKTAERMEVADLTDTMYEVDGYIMIYVAEAMDEGWWNIFKVYDNSTWALFFVILILECVFVCFVNQIEIRWKFKKNVRNRELVWSVIRLQLFQAASTKLYFFAGKFSLWLFSLLQCSMFLGILTSWFLASIIIVDKHDAILNEGYIFDQIAKGHRRLISQGNTEWFYNETGESYFKLTTALKGHTAELVDPMKIISRVRDHGDLIYVHSDTGSYLEAKRYCDIKHTKVTFPSIGAHIMLPKNSTLLPLFNKAIRENKRRLTNIYRRYNTLKLVSVCDNFVLGDALRK
ncbi:unnamed protein product [Bursaphelenchus okinawaensis]|uniref:PBPb domain-containing protein n=1 Tax=Bursaphelenchus okinawaensis TaxID=465554 RepID=A0A811LPR1_9BILA|nr:unnamed protein product [Bursaphelenchus okinawaensis]CAG9125139.1 unnamed protein product [Bursaphelenchus okinawaensis]